MTNSTNVGLLAFLILFSIIFYVCIKSSRLKIGDSIIRLIMTTRRFSAASVADINKCFVQANKKALAWPHISWIKPLFTCRWNTLLLFPPNSIFSSMATPV